MNTDDMQSLWQNEDHGSVTGDQRQVLEVVQKKNRQLRTTIFWRDIREIVIGLILIPIFYLGARKPEQPWSLYLTIPAIVFVIGFILVDRQIQKRKRLPAGGHLMNSLAQAIADVKHQIWLLKHIAWWYLFPLYVAINFYFIHVAFITADTAIGAAVAAAVLVSFSSLLYWLIYKLNQYAVKKDLEPRLQELLAIQADFQHANE